MNKPSSKSRISARTAPEIVSEVKLAVVRLAGRGLVFRGRKLGIEGFLAGVLLEVLALPDDQIRAILERRLPEVERLFEGAGVGLEGEETPGVERPPGEAGGFRLPGGGRTTPIEPPAKGKAPAPRKSSRKGNGA